MLTIQNDEQFASQSPWKDYLVVGIGWPLINLLTLLGFVILRSSIEQVYTDSYDYKFIIFAFLTVLGHVVAFALPIYVFRKSLIKFQDWLLTVLLFLTVIGQLFWRYIATGLSRIDCNDNCVNTIIPAQLDQTVTCIVAATLIITLGIVLVRRISQESNSSS